MPHKIHMHDQVNNKIDAIMRHYRCFPVELGNMKILLLVVFLILGMYW